jgi:exoribonuclease R
MPRSTARLAAPPVLLQQAELIARFDEIRSRAGVPADFSPEALAEAAQAVLEPSDADLTDIPFVTIDPTGATDLDQAMCLTRRPDGRGYHVDYAIADVPAFVLPGGAIAAEAMVRGQTLYAPDRHTPLHPPALSQDAASLLPDVVRPAFVWRFDLDELGVVQSVDLVRATVRSRRQLDYAQVQAALDTEDAGALGELGRLLQEIGERRQTLEQARGGASLPLPEQEVSADDSKSGFTLRLRAGRPIEDWNAQLSLMTGIAAAELMLKAGVGVLRTLPAPEAGAMKRFRRQAVALGIDWPEGESYGTFLRRMDGGRPKELALLHAAGALFRGAAYAPFDGTPPEQTQHAAVASAYAHVTAPLRRLVDRFGLVAAHAAHRGEPAPEWVRAGLPLLPAAMSASDRLTGEVERRCVDAVEIAVLAGRAGEEFDAVVVDADEDSDGGRVQLLEPPVLSRSSGRLSPGATVRVRLDLVDEATSTLKFSAVPQS